MVRGCNPYCLFCFVVSFLPFFFSRFSPIFLCTCILSNFSREIANVGFLAGRLYSLSWPIIPSNDLQGGVVIDMSEEVSVD